MKNRGIQKFLLIAAGFLSLALGLVGIVVPVLPTTPFVLLAAALFVRSSDRLYRRLLSSPLFGKYLADFSERKGMTLKAKISSLGVMWVMIGLSIIFIESALWRAMLVLLGCTGSLIMGILLRTVPPGGPRDGS